MQQAEITSFLREYSSGTYRKDDHKRFVEWLNKASVREIKGVMEVYKKMIENRPLSDNPPDRIIRLVESALDRRATDTLVPKPRNAKRRMIGKRLRIGVAAAVAVLVIGLGYWLLTKNESRDIKEQVAALKVHDVPAPTSAKATITLSNGKVIYLDSVDNGILSRQNSVNIVKTNGSQVVYTNLSEQTEPDKVKYNTLYNPKGSMVVSLTLADGTKVWLNAASSLHYPVAFSGKERKVSITGEAYFEVARNPDKKFLVEADGVVTEVLGTHFNINAYKEDGRTEVTLLEGAVRVGNTASSAVILPGQQAVVTNSIHVVNHVDLDVVMAWKNGKFIMKSANISSIMHQISRWYNINVTYEAGIPDVRISGEVSRNLSLLQMLKVLEYSGVHVKLDSSGVVVMP